MPSISFRRGFEGVSQFKHRGGRPARSLTIYTVRGTVAAFILMEPLGELFTAESGCRMRDQGITRHFVALSAACAITVMLTACTPEVVQRGVMPDVDDVARITPQQTTKADVERTLGSPSSVTMFGGETWIYVGESTERLAFFEKKVNERSVVMITFGADGLVSKVESHGLEASRDIEPEERTTPTVGNKLTFMDQLIGNVNRLGQLGQQ